jgi:hypothetical protein
VRIRLLAALTIKQQTNRSSTLRRIKGASERISAFVVPVDRHFGRLGALAYDLVSLGGELNIGLASYS